MKAPLAYPTWDQIAIGCGRLAVQLSNFEHTPTLIVGLSRGGLIPGVQVSHLMNLPFATIEYSSNDGNGETATGIEGDLEYQVQYLTNLHGSDEMFVVIIDDIVDTGHTMADVVSMFVKKDWHVASAGLFVRDGSVHEPSIEWQRLQVDDSWVVFPWEL